MSPLGAFLAAFVLLLAALAVAMYLLNVPPLWIAAGMLLLAAVAFLLVTNRRTPRDPGD